MNGGAVLSVLRSLARGLRLLLHSHSLRRVGSDGSSRAARGGSLVKIHGFPHADALDLFIIGDCPLAITPMKVTSGMRRL